MGAIDRYYRTRAELRAKRFGRRSGVTIGPGTRLAARASVFAGDGATVEIGRDVEIGVGTVILAQPGATLTIGDRVFISGSCVIAASRSLSIGAESMIAEMVMVRDHDHDPDQPPRSGGALVGPVTVGERVWLASKSSVTRGVTIGDDAVLGAHAVATRDIPAGGIAVGVPARVVRVKDQA